MQDFFHFLEQGLGIALLGKGSQGETQARLGQGVQEEAGGQGFALGRQGVKIPSLTVRTSASTLEAA